MASIYEQVKTAQVNSFTGGMNTDLHPMVQPSDTMTDCLNGTLITYQGNENIIQNDMGNYELKNAKLPEGYIPLGMKEHNGIIYIVSTNPITGKTQIGSYPSPQTLVEDGDPIERSIKEIEIPYIKDKEGNIIGIKDEKGKYTDIDLFEYLETNGYNALTSNAESIVFSDLFDDMTQITNNDKYELVNSSYNDETNDSKFQYDQFFILDSDNKITNIDPPKIVSNFNGDSEDIKTNVSWDIPGWLGFKHKLYTPKKHIQNIRGSVVKTIGSDNLELISTEIEQPRDMTDISDYFYAKVKEGWTMNIKDICDLVPDSEIWMIRDIDSNSPIPEAINYTVTEHTYDESTNTGIIRFSTNLNRLPECLFDQYSNGHLSSLDLPNSMTSINDLTNPDNLIIGPYIKNISIQTNLKTISIRGILKNTLEIISTDGHPITVYVSQVTDDIKNLISYKSTDESDQSANLTITENLELAKERLSNEVIYTCGYKYKICEGYFKNGNIEKIKCEFPIINAIGFEKILDYIYDRCHTLIFSKNTWGVHNIINRIWTKKPNYDHPRRFVYYRQSKEPTVELHDDIKDIVINLTEPFNNLLFNGCYRRINLENKSEDNEGKVVVSSYTNNILNIHIPIVEGQWWYNSTLLYLYFEQFFISNNDIVTYVPLNTNSRLSALSINVYSKENKLIFGESNNIYNDNNSITVNHVFSSIPIVNGLTFNVFTRVYKDNDISNYKKDYLENIKNSTVSQSISGLPLPDYNTNYLIIESVPYYEYDKKILILDNLKEIDKISVNLEKSSLFTEDIKVLKFQYELSNNVFKVTLEFNQTINDETIVKNNKLYYFRNGNIVDSGISGFCEYSISDQQVFTITIPEDHKDDKFFVFEIENIYKGILVNNTETKFINYKDTYDDYNKIPNILNFISNDSSVTITNPRVVYMYVPIDCIKIDKSNIEILPDKCSNIEYYDKPFILSKDQVINNGYIGIGIIGDVKIDNDLLFESNISVDFNIKSSNLSRLTQDNNIFTVLCKYSIVPWTVKKVDNPNANSIDSYITREYLIKSMYPPFTLMQKENNSGLNYKLTPEIIRYAEWTDVKNQENSKIINLEKQSGKNLGLHIEAVSTYDAMADSTKGDVYTTDFSNLMNQLKNNQLFFFFNCKVATKNNGIVIPLSVMYNDLANAKYWWYGSHIRKKYKVTENNAVLSLVATRQSEWLKSSSFLDKFKDRGINNFERVLATIGVTAGVAALTGWFIGASIISGIPVVGPLILSVAAVIGLFIFLSKIKLKDRYWCFIGLRYDGSQKDSAPFVIPMWGSRRTLRSYMLTDEDQIERAEQRLMVFCKNVYYLKKEELYKNIEIPSKLESNPTTVTNKIDIKITSTNKGPITQLYEGVYISDMPEVLSNIIGLENYNVSIGSNDFTTINATEFEDIDYNILFEKFIDGINLQITILHTKSGTTSFIVDKDRLKDLPNEISNDIISRLESCCKHLIITDNKICYNKWTEQSQSTEDSLWQYNSVQGNRGGDWKTFWVHRKKDGDDVKIHAGEELVPDDGYAPLARPCNAVEYSSDEKNSDSDGFMVPNQPNMNGTSWEDWEKASQLDPPDYLVYLASIYGIKKL